MTEDPRQGTDGVTPSQREVSDLIGAELAVALIAWLLVTLAAFFFIGPVVGLVLVVLGVAGFGWAAVAAIRRADTSD